MNRQDIFLLLKVLIAVVMWISLTKMRKMNDTKQGWRDRGLVIAVGILGIMLLTSAEMLAVLREINNE